MAEPVYAERQSRSHNREFAGDRVLFTTFSPGVTRRMKVLMIDVGGTNVKLMATGQTEFRKFRSGAKLTAAQMVRAARKATADWDYEVVSIGFPGLLANGQITRNPLNLGGCWVGFDFEKAFERPVRLINDAAMQALANYETGRMLFIGLGTSIGTTLIADDTIIPLETGLLRISKRLDFAHALSKPNYKENPKLWRKHAAIAIAILRDMFWPEKIVLGGGNAEKVEPLPKGVLASDNQAAFRGAERLWPGTNMVAEAQATTWRITRCKKSRRRKRS